MDITLARLLVSVMGNKVSPSYACLFLGDIENQIWHSYRGKFSEVYVRCIDAGMGLTQMSLEELNQFIHLFSNLSPAIKFTSKISANSVYFLDMTINNDFPILTSTVR